MGCLLSLARLLAVSASGRLGWMTQVGESGLWMLLKSIKVGDWTGLFELLPLRAGNWALALLCWVIFRRGVVLGLLLVVRVRPGQGETVVFGICSLSFVVISCMSLSCTARDWLTYLCLHGSSGCYSYFSSHDLTVNLREGLTNRRMLSCRVMSWLFTSLSQTNGITSGAVVAERSR